MQGIARRSASITLMAIMVAGGMTIAFPGATPDAMAEPRRLANLGVSTTMFGGPMVVEIVVQDPNIDDTGIQQGAPDVTFDGKDLVMIQGDDGYWYAYVARDQVVGGIETFYRDEVGRSHRLGTGLDYGTRCEPDERDAIIPGTEFAAKNVYVANYTCGSESGQTTDVSLNVMNVVRSAKTPSTPGGVGSDPGDNIGNNGMSSLAYWPFIQTFDDISDDSQLKVIYNKGGSPQEITIRYESDMDDFASLVLDRENYPHNTFVHMTLNEALFNVDPTDEDLWSWLASVGADPTGQARAGLYYYMFDSDRELALTGPSRADDTDIIEGEQSGVEVYGDLFTLMDFGTSGPLIYTTSQFGNGDGQVRAVNPTPRDEHINRADRNPLGLPQTGNGMRLIFSEAPFLTIEETGPNTGVFTNTDGNNRSDLITGDPDSIGRDVPFTFTYADTAQNWFVGYHTGSVSMDEASVGSDWSSGERMTISVTDQDHNRNSLVQERLVIGADNPDLFRVLAGPDPSLVAGFPMIFPGAGGGGTTAAATPITPDGKTTYNENAIDLDSVGGGRHGLSTAVDNGVPISAADTLVAGLAPDRALYAQFDLREIGGPDTKFQILDQDNTAYTDPIPADGRIVRMDTMATGAAADFTGDIKIQVRDTVNNPAGRITIQMVLYLYDISDTIYQAEGRLDPLTTGGLGATLEETGLNTGIFDGTIEYTMLNQLNTEFGGAPNTETAATSTGILTDEIRLVVNGDYLDEDGIRIDYEDTDKQGQETVASAQVDAPTHSGSVSLDQDSYKQADTVSITLEDTDLNLDPQLRDVYTAITDLTDNNRDTISRAGQFYATSADQGLLLEATFDDERWISCGTAATAPKGFGTLISSIRETAPTSGVFVADFQIPDEYCSPLVEDNMDGNPVIIGASVAKTTLGKDFEVSYYDYFDSAGERNEVGDVAGITSFTGSISLDRSVYPVPFDNGNRDGASNAVFRFHETLKASDSSDEPRYVPNGAAATGATAERDDVNGDVVIHVQINDKDLDTSGSGTDRIEDASTVLKVEISRDGNSIAPASATDTVLATKEIVETSPTSGIFEIDLGIAWNDGPWQGCPRGDDAFPSEDDTATATVDERRCLLQGDIITVTYTDASDATGNENTVTDSATFDLRNGVLQSDKSVYIIGSDMILTLIDPDLDLDNDGKQSYSLDLIEWDSDAATVTMGRGGGSHASFDPEPATLQETGDSTGIFQSIVEIPESLQGEELDRGEEIALEYTDWGPSGADFVGEESQDISLTVYTSNFGATIELDQKVYSWTDKVFITIVAPDHNFDSSLIDEIGRDTTDPLQIATQEGKIDNYRLAETGPDTGIFTGEVILTGFQYDINDDITVTPRGPTGDGPTDGLLPATDDDGVTVSYEYSEDETVVGSSLIRWNIGEAEWLAASYPASGTGVIRVIDPDMNINPEAVDNFQITVISDSVASGISLTVTETSQAAGIFEGTVFFTTTDAPTGSRLRVAEGDTITAEYDDTTLPDPYSRNDELTISATALIGTIVPPLERVPVSNLRVVDNFGATLDTVQVDQQVQVTADLTNGQTRDQAFAYLVQIQDEDNVTVHLAWISGSVAEGQSFSPSVSWTPAASGTYTATTFAWESVSNPEALSPPVSLEITVG